MIRLIVGLALVVGVIGLGILVSGLRKKSTSNKAPYQKYSPVPSKVNLLQPDSRTSFNTPLALWVFTAKSCKTCPGVMKLARQLESNQVSVLEFSFEQDKDIHQLYAIDSIPLTLIVNQTGDVEKWFLGALHLAEAREHIALKIGSDENGRI